MHAASDHPGATRHVVGEFEIVQCERCGFLHATPTPGVVELAQVYRHDYYSTEKPAYIERYREDQAWWDLVNDDRLDDLEGVIDGARGRLLDVGSGPGLLLERARGRGWDVVGLEPSRQAAEYTRSLGLPVVEAFLEDDATTALGTFDAVHSAAVLEHVPDPLGMLRAMHRMLRPGGALLIVVPNDDNPVQRAACATLRIAPWWVTPPHHLNYFSPTTLSLLVQRAGFEVVDLATSFPIDQFLLMGEPYVGNDAVGRAVHRRRMSFELAMDAAGERQARRNLARAMATAGIGREIVLVARRMNE